jgi:hypothetical protein
MRNDVMAIAIWAFEDEDSVMNRLLMPGFLLRRSGSTE